MSILIHNARQVVCVSNSHQTVKLGPDMRQLCILTNVSVGIRNGVIVAVGDANPGDYEVVLDAKELCVVPGLVDGHTHALFSGDRCHEFAMKLEGATYLDIHKAGGGIMFTVRHVREATEEDLYTHLMAQLDRMLHFGTTVAEVKSGYGLDLDSEVKMLRVIRRAELSHEVTVVANYLPAHSVVPGHTAESMVQDIVSNQIPVIKTLKEQGEINPELIDVFCEQGIFEVEETRAILQAGRSIGLKPNLHLEELKHLGSGVMAAQQQAVGVSHLEHLDAEGIAALAQTGTVGVALPTTQYMLHLPPAPVRQMIDAGMPVALASDYNPNAPCLSLPLVMHLGCINLGLTMAEALVACTLNAAASLGKSEMYGSIELGKAGDLVLVKAPSWEHLIYQLGDAPIEAVVKAGRVVATPRH